MAFGPFRRSNFLTSIRNSLLSSPRFCKFSSSKASTSIEQDRGRPFSSRLHLSPLFSDDIPKYDLNDCKIGLVDDETWRVSSALADAWRGRNKDRAFKMTSGFNLESSDNSLDNSEAHLHERGVDFDAIEDMRIRGSLFYKLDKDSKEYEEYRFDFHGRKCSKNEKDRKQSKEKEKEGLNKKGSTKIEVVTSRKDRPEAIKKKLGSNSKIELLGSDGNKSSMGDTCIGKRQRTQTFNQLTAPYHEPFCLDIHVTKGSVRASIIHRATSQVVVVSHSISKDMKFDVGSCKNRSACAAVGEVLAQRALADDIHNAVYTPRRGEKLEGKLLIVLKSIMNGGVNVNVRLKQKKLRRKTTGPIPHA